MRLRWALVCVAVLGACGGGGSGSSSGGSSTLSLAGLPIPTTGLTDGVKQLCTVAAQAHTDPAGSNNAFYGGPHTPLHQLVAVLAQHHSGQANSLLNTMVKYETDLTQTPPPPTTGDDADALVHAASAALVTLKVTPPTC